MCTLSIIGLPDGGYRVVQNRDEKRVRGRAYPPAWRTLGSGRRVQYPTDSDAGGTWIALSEHGVLCGVLNYRMHGRMNPAASQSRGEIPLMLIEHEHPESMLKELRSTDLSVYACFTAFAVVPSSNGPRVLIARWDAETLSVIRDPLHPFEPAVVASSGLGDELVQGRVPLFGEMVASDPTPDMQDAFHRHRWDDRPQFSVLMSRPDARTVSITTIEVGGADQPMMVYEELTENDPVTDPVGAGMLQ